LLWYNQNVDSIIKYQSLHFLIQTIARNQVITVRIRSIQILIFESKIVLDQLD